MTNTPLNLKAIISASMVMSNEETRYYLCGVYTHVKYGKRHYVGTDGRALVNIALPVDKTDTQEAFIIPAETIKLIRTMLKGRKINFESTLSAFKDNKGVIELHHNGQSISFVAIDGNFPDYERVYPEDLKARTPLAELVLDLKTFAAVCEAEAFWSGGKRYPCVKLNIHTERGPMSILKNDGQFQALLMTGERFN